MVIVGWSLVLCSGDGVVDVGDDDGKGHKTHAYASASADIPE